MRGIRSGLRGLAVATVLVLLGNVALPADASPSTVEHGSTTSALGGQTVNPANHLGEALAKAKSDAWDFASENPDLVGYPWADHAKGVLVLSAVGNSGETLLRQWAPKDAAANAVPRRIRTVERSWGFLERIKHGATFLVQAGVPDADLIYRTAPDAESNRVKITVTRRSDALFAALAARYGTDIVIEVDPNRPPLQRMGRDNDTSPFWGGANINCTSGFSFTNSRMISAGHCWPVPNGGSVYTPVVFMGTVSGGNTNWQSGNGTVLFHGDSMYRGDLARIDIQNGQTSAGRIYRGVPGSSDNAPVKELWYRSPNLNDQFCTGGHKSGELCAWGVDDDHPTDHLLFSGEWVRNSWAGRKAGGGCIQKGDSGGPIYTVRPDNGIAAKGIISSAGDFGGFCVVIFTDLRLANAWWPSLLTQ